MDSFDYIFNFSSELLLFALALIMVVLNVVSFGIAGFHKENIADQSLAAKFLALHSGLNNKLYVHNSAVKTTVLAGSNFAPTAFAAGTESLLADNENSIDGDSDQDSDFESVITKPPVDAKDLLQNQIVVYQTQSGDTLSSVAKKFGISTSTVAWSNSLRPGDTIKPNWFLIISPNDKTITVKTTKSDSIPGLAKKFGVSEDTIINANALGDAGDIDSGIYLYIPGGTVKDAPKPTPTKPGSTIKIPSLGQLGNVFPKGQCTWYVASQIKVYWRGNAKDWPRNAAAAGATVNHVAGVGKIAVTPDSRYGHVSMVRKVYDNGTLLLEDYNYSGKRQHGTHIERISRVQAFITP